MANFTKTISNSIEVFGLAPASVFDLYNWNAFYWGEGTTPTIRGYGKPLSETLTLTQSMTGVYRRAGSGWYYLYSDDVTNAASRYEPTWTQVTVSSTV